MAFTFTDFKKAVRAMFGYGQTNVSGDGGGDLKDHAARLVSRVAGPVPLPLNATGTNLLDAFPIFCAENECDVRSIRVTIEAALTTTATDYTIYTVHKRKSPSWSLTESVATLNFGQTSLWTVNKAGMSKAFTLATTQSVIDMDPGDTLTVKATLAATNLIGRPAIAFTTEYEEK